MVEKIDTSAVSVKAFNTIKNAKKGQQVILGQDDTKISKSPNFTTRVRVYTNQDKKNHKYFTEINLDMSVDDFLHTCELTCPYDSDLMEYWEIIRQTCVVYGTNRGAEKILFIGRVRELKQEGFSLKITLQSYAWKFKQTISQAYANDNVLNKDALTIFKLMFEALKIDSWVISPITRNRLKEVGINSDGNLTVNQEEITEMPDLLERLKKAKPSEAVNKYTLNNKLKEHYVHNLDDINYTLKYEKPTKRMQKIASEGSYSAGKNIYENAYGSASGGGASGAGGSGSGNGCDVSVTTMCPAIKSTSIQSAVKTIYQYQHGCANEYGGAKNAIIDYARSNPSACRSQVIPCLRTLAKYPPGKGRDNAAQIVADSAESACSGSSPAQTISNGVQTASNIVSNAINTGVKALNNAGNWWHNKVTGLVNGIFGTKFK